MASSPMVQLCTALEHQYTIAQGVKRKQREDWEEVKPFLKQKLWALDQQQTILAREVENLMTQIETHESHVEKHLDAVARLLRPGMVKFYSQHNPSKVKNVDILLRHFRGREVEMVREMKETYAGEVDVSGLVRHGLLTEDGQDTKLDGLIQKRDDLWKEVAHLEDMVFRVKEQVEQIKRELHFPSSHGWRFKHGYDGVYFGLQDFWLEEISGRVVLELLHGVKSPRILVRIVGPSNAPGEQLKGAKLSFRADKCGIVGEKGSKVPNMSPEQLSVAVSFIANVPLEFRGSNWRIHKGFQLKVIDLERTIKGSSIPVPKAILRMVLNHMLPGLIKVKLLEWIPLEFGVYLRQCGPYKNAHPGPSAQQGKEAAKHAPMRFEVNLSIIGHPLKLGTLDTNVISEPLESADPAQRDLKEQARLLLGLSSDSIRVVRDSIKLVGDTLARMREQSLGSGAQPTLRPPMRSVLDFIRYINSFSGEIYCTPKNFTGAAAQDASRDREALNACAQEIVAIWDQVSRIVQDSSSSASSTKAVGKVGMGQLFQNVKRISRKPVHLDVAVQNIFLHSSLESLLDMTRDILLRRATELHDAKLKRSAFPTKSLSVQKKQLNAWHASVHDPLNKLKKVFKSFRVNVCGVGDQGQFMVVGHDLSFRGPIGVYSKIAAGLHQPMDMSARTSVSPLGKFNVDLLLGEESPLVDDSVDEREARAGFVEVAEKPRTIVASQVRDSLSSVSGMHSDVHDVGVHLACISLQNAKATLSVDMKSHLERKLQESIRNSVRVAVREALQGEASHMEVGADEQLVYPAAPATDNAERVMGRVLGALDQTLTSELSSVLSRDFEAFSLNFAMGSAKEGDPHAPSAIAHQDSEAEEEVEESVSVIEGFAADSKLHYEVKATTHEHAFVSASVESFQVSGDMQTVHSYVRGVINDLAKEDGNLEADQAKAYKPFQMVADRLTKYIRSDVLRMSSLFVVEATVVPSKPSKTQLRKGQSREELCVGVLPMKGDPRPVFAYENSFNLLDLIEDVQQVLGSFLDDD